MKHSPKVVRKLKDFKTAQRTFDKTLKAKKRDFCHGRQLYMDKANSANPTSFWEYVKKLGAQAEE